MPPSPLMEWPLPILSSDLAILSFFYFLAFGEEIFGRIFVVKQCSSRCAVQHCTEMY